MFKSIGKYIGKFLSSRYLHILILVGSHGILL